MEWLTPLLYMMSGPPNWAFEVYTAFPINWFKAWYPVNLGRGIITIEISVGGGGGGGGVGN